MNKLFFQLKLLLVFSITTILLVLGSCSDSSSSSNDIGGKVVPDIENVKVTKINANVEFEFDVTPSTDAVKIVAKPVLGRANSPLNSVLGNVLATTYELDDAKPITVTVPRTDFLVFSDDYVGKVVLKSLRPYTSYSFSISALSGSSESAARVDFPEVSVPINSDSPEDKILSVIVEKASPIKLKWKNGHKDGYQEGIDDFTKVRFYVYDGAKKIASYLVDNPSIGEVSLVVLTNREDSTFYKIKAVYISVNGIESDKRDLISFTPSQLKSDINPVEGLTIAAKNIEGSADASEALYISWDEYDYSKDKAGTSITVSISVASYVISDITVDKDSVSLPSFVKEVKREGELDIYSSKNAIWINNLYGVKNYTASVVVHDDSGSVSQAVTASASTIDTTTEPVSYVELTQVGNGIIVTWDRAFVSDYAGANLKLVDSSKEKTDTGYEIKTIQVRGYNVEKAIFSALEAKKYNVEVIAVDIAGNISSPVESEDPITIEESDVKKGESPGKPTKDGDPIINYRADGMKADVLVSWNAPANEYIKDYTVVLMKQEGDNKEAADKTEVKTITVKDTQVTFTKLQRPTAENVVIYSVSVYATDEFGNSSKGKKDKTLTINIELDKAVASSLEKGKVEFANIDGKTSARLYGAIVNSGVLSIKADVTVPAKKIYLLALYDTSDNNNPIAVAIADNSSSNSEDTKTVYFTEEYGIRIPHGTEKEVADEDGVKGVEEGGMTYNAQLFEVFDNFLSTGTELDPITVADTVSIITTGATIQALVFNTTTGELEVTFTEADLTDSKSPSDEKLTDAQVLYRIYATTDETDESIKEDDHDKKLASIKASNHKSVDVAGDTDPLKGSLFGFDTGSKSFSVAIETISTLNTAISGTVTSVTKVATEKTNQAFKGGAKFEYAGNNGKNVYVYSFDDGSKDTEVPTGSNIQLKLPEGAVDNRFALTPFSIKYIRGTRFIVDDGSGNDAVTINGIRATTQASGELNNGAAGKITVNTNVEEVGTGVYRVSLSATGDKVPYVTLFQEVIITISPKDDISNVKPVFESVSGETIGKLIIFEKSKDEEGEKEVFISFSSLPSGKENLGKYYYIEKFQQQTLIADSDDDLIKFEFDSSESDNSKIRIIVQKAAADKGPYSLLITPESNYAKELTGSIKIDFDVSTKKSTAFEYVKNVYHFVKNKKVTVKVKPGAEHPNDKKGTFTVYPELPAGLSFNNLTGAITGKPTTVQDYPQKYRVTYTPHADKLATHTVYSTEIAIFITEEELEMTYKGGASSYSYTVNIPIEAVTIEKNSLRNKHIRGRYYHTNLPKGLSLDADTGAITGTPKTEVLPSSVYLIEFIPNKDEYPRLEAKVTIVVKKAVELSYVHISGRVDVALPEVEPKLTRPDGFTGEGTFEDTDDLVGKTGLIFDTSTGAISGKPTKAVTTPEEFTVTYTPPTEHQDEYGKTLIEVSISIYKGIIDVSYIAISGRVNEDLGTVKPKLTLPDGFTGEGTFEDTDDLVGKTGLIFDTSTGAISGKPTKAVTPARTFTVTYTPPTEHQDEYGKTLIEVSISIAKGTISVSYAAISGRVNEVLNDLIIPTLSPNITGGRFADTDDLEGLTGLDFDTSIGAISGTPTKAVTPARTFTVTYTPSPEEQDNYENTPLEVEVSISIAKGTISVSYDDINGRVGEALDEVIPTLPDFISGGRFADTDDLEGLTGLDFDTSIGAISGTPTKAVTPARTFTVTYTPSPEEQDNYENTPLEVEVSISIAKGTLGISYDDINGRVGEALDEVIPTLPEGITRGTFVDTDGLAEATGLTFNTDTGAISGTPDTVVDRDFIVTYTPVDQANYENTPIEVSISIAKGTLGISYDDINGRVGEALDEVIPTLPDFISGGRFADTDGLAEATGLTFNTDTGAISGTPDTVVDRDFIVTYTPVDQANYENTPIEVSISIAKGTLGISYDDINGRVGEALDEVIPTLPDFISGGRFADTDALETYTGLDFNIITGAISGTPDTAIPNIKFTVTYTPPTEHQDEYGKTPIEVEVSISIAKGTISVSYAVINGRVGDALSVSYDAINGRVGVALNLPVIPALKEPDGFAGRGTFADTDGLARATGLTFNTRTGVISGTPRKAVSTEEFTVTYTPSSADQANYGNTQIEVSISIAKGTISFGYDDIVGSPNEDLGTFSPTLPSGVSGGRFTDGGLASETGLEFDESTGVISGTTRNTPITKTYIVTYTPSSADQANYKSSPVTTQVSVEIHD